MEKKKKIILDPPQLKKRVFSENAVLRLSLYIYIYIYIYILHGFCLKNSFRCYHGFSSTNFFFFLLNTSSLSMLTM